MLTKNRQKLVDQFTTVSTSWKINESTEDSIVDGENILARVVGQFFLVNKASLNKRFYSEELWEACISECETNGKFLRGELRGTIGHDLVLDAPAMREGYVSHYVTKLFFNEDRTIGLGEILILGTPTGHILNKMMRGGSPLPVSSRAYGDIAGKNEFGEDIIDPKSFFLEGFDFVVTAGVGAARPRIVEDHTLEQGDIKMDFEKLLTSLNEEKVQTQVELREALKKVGELEAKNEELKKQHEQSQRVVRAYQSHCKSVEGLKELREGLMKWLVLGEPFAGIAKEIGLFDGNGLTTDLLKKSLGLTESLISTFGSRESIKAKFEKLAKYEALGSDEDFGKAKQLNEAYGKFGAPGDLTKRIEVGNRAIKHVANQIRNKNAKEIAQEFGINESVVFDMIKTGKPEEVKKELKKLQETNELAKRYKVTSTSGSGGGQPAPKTQGSATVAGSFFESFGPKAAVK